MSTAPHLDDHLDDHRDDGVVDGVGLLGDVTGMLGRRRALQLLAGAGLVALAGCATTSSGSGSAGPSIAGSPGGSTGGATSTTATTAAASTLEAIPEETAGPYPGDGSNGPDVLRESGVVRQDITTSLSGGAAAGVPMRIDLTIQDVARGGVPYAGAAVYAWHADAQGRYSMYSEGVEDETYLRGVQVADSSGTLSFTSVFPGCYDGRWPHVHFEVYASEADATSGGSPVATSQLALPHDACEAAYSADGYDGSASNLTRVSLQTDMVFRDGVSQQLATVSGSVDDGYVATLAVPV